MSNDGYCYGLSLICVNVRVNSLRFIIKFVSFIFVIFLGLVFDFKLLIMNFFKVVFF